MYCRSSTSSRTSRTTLRLSLGLQAHLTQNFHPPVLKCLHEIKHDGFRIIARKSGAQVRLYSRPGNDLTRRFPLIVETLARLRSRSCIIDGEAVAPAMRTALPRSISSVPNAQTGASFSTPST